MSEERVSPSWIRRCVVSGLLLLASCLVAFGLCELVLRFRIDDPADLFCGLNYAPELNSRYLELVFLRRYTTKPATSIASDIQFDPYLGWDSKAGEDRIRGDRVYAPEPPAGTRRIITIGDSFTYGCEVKDDETYSHYLEELIDGVEVLNMGAGGFGMDQAILKYLRYGRALRPDLLVFGIHPPNWERCTLSFNAYTKPRFVYDRDRGEVTLTNTAHVPPEEMVDRLRQAAPCCYLVPFLRQQYLQLRWSSDPNSQESYWLESTMVVKHAFEQLLTALKEDGVPLLIVQIPLGGHFESDERVKAGQNANMEMMYLRGMYDAFNISCIDLMVELPQRYPREQIYQEFYLHHPNGNPTHLSPSGNRVVAELIRDRLQKPLSQFKHTVELEWDEALWRD